MAKKFLENIEITSSASDTSGLKLVNLTSKTFLGTDTSGNIVVSTSEVVPVADESDAGKILIVDEHGDAVWSTAPATGVLSVTGVNAINSTEDVDPVISLKINPADKTLSQSATGLLSTIGIAYNTTSGVLSLTGNSGEVIGTVNLPLEKFLKSAEIVNEDDQGTTGIFLKLVFATQGSADSTVYINLAQLVDIYRGGNGIEISDTNVVSAKIAAGSNLTATADGIGFATGYQAMTAAESTKLAGIEEGAEVNDVVDVTVGDVSVVNGSKVAVIPAPPVVNDAKLTITLNGVATEFTANAATDKSITLNTVKKYDTTITPVVNTATVVTHGLNTENIVIAVYDATTKEEVGVEKVITGLNTITVTSTTTNSLKVVVLGL